VASDKSPTRKRAVIAAGVVGLPSFLLCFFIWWGRPPQMGGDKEVVRSVDALFTAITARDQKLLGQCEKRLHAHNNAGKLPPEASHYLDGIIQKARAGRWEPAAERLYEFMKAQRPLRMRRG
jgi:hypothetical protein